MRIFADKRIRRLLMGILLLLIILMTGIAVSLYIIPEQFRLCLFLLAAVVFGLLFAMLFRYFKRTDRIMEQAASTLEQFAAGHDDVRIPCDEEGELYRLFHEVNQIMGMSGARIEAEAQSKAFLKDTISDISHQLKTPLAALQIYNGILQDDTVDDVTLRKFTDLSEQELDRVSTLVGNLLKIAKLDAKTTPLHKKEENIFDLMQEIRERFSWRAESEQKNLSFTGDESVSIYCDRSWLSEAISNIVKNALDHTKAGDHILVEWKKLTQVVQIIVTDSGSGIHPDDLHHIFKRFYRSRYAQDSQGIGLGLPLAKAIIEAHDGTIEVRSTLGRGTIFTVNLLIPTKL